MQRKNTMKSQNQGQGTNFKDEKLENDSLISKR